MACRLCLGMAMRSKILNISKPRPGFFAGINEWLKEPIKFSKKIKIIKSPFKRRKVSPSRIKYNMLHLNLNYF